MRIRLAEELHDDPRQPIPQREDARGAPGELQRAKDHLKGSLMLGLESTSSRMSHLARQDIYGDQSETLDSMLAEIDGVSEAAVMRVAHQIFSSGPLALTVLGGDPACAVTAEQLSLA